MLGRKVATLVNARQSAGLQTYNFNPASYSLSSGIYVYKLAAGAYSETKKMVFMK